MSPLLRSHALTAALVLAAAVPVMAQAPAFDVQALGVGSPTDVNSAGTVVGIEGTSPATRPWIIRDGVRHLLPLPAGATGAYVTHVSETDTAAGYTTGTGLPLLWTAAGSGFTVTTLPVPPGNSAAVPAGISAAGTVLLNAGNPVFYAGRPFFSSTTPYLYEAGTLVSVWDRYGLAGTPGQAADMAASGRILLSTGAILNPDGTVTAAPSWMAGQGWQGLAATHVNEGGTFVGSVSLATSDGHISLVRYTPGPGWSYIEHYIGAMYAAATYGLSDTGMAVGVAYGGTWLSGPAGERYALWQLLNDPRYAIGAAYSAMSANGLIATVASGPAGATAVLLTPSGTVPLPAAVTLTGTPHPATPSAPWDAISLTWTSSPGASAYLVERKGPADADFVALTPASGTIQLLYDDTAIVLGATYSYRVKAIGISGAGPASNVVTVQAPPPATNDTEAPVVSILAPARRATVSGVVRVEATATDNVGVTRMELRDGSGALLASVAGGRLVYDWNTAGLKRNANQTLRVRAFDAKGNSATASVTVRIGR